MITTHDFVLDVMLFTVVCLADENTSRVDQKTDQVKRKQDNEIINYIKEVRVSTVSNTVCIISISDECSLQIVTDMRSLCCESESK